MEKEAKTGKYYADVYYIRYLIYLNGNNYDEIHKRHRAERKKQGDSAAPVLLDRRQLSNCCEGVKYEPTKADIDETAEELPTVSEKFVDAFCEFFSIDPKDAFLDKKKTDEERQKSHDRQYWEKKRKELRSKRDKMIAYKEKETREKELAELKKHLTGYEDEAARLEELLVTALKICNVGYLSRIFEYLADLLQPQTRHFWITMEERLAGLNPYLGYPEVIKAGRIETADGWDYPVMDEFSFQKEEPLDRKILTSLEKRQGIEKREDLAKALSNDEVTLSRPGLYRLINGESRTDFKKKAAERIGEVLHAGWEDMKGEGPCFWTEQDGAALWETAEEQMRQVVRKLRPEDWAGMINGNDTTAELYLAVKNILRFSLCCYEPEKNRKRLEELESRAAQNPKTPAADALFSRCIQELKEEQPAWTALRYQLLMNGMNVELNLKAAFENQWKESLLQKAEEAVMEFCRTETCTDEEKTQLKKLALESLKNKQRQHVFEGVRKIWLQAMEEHVCPNPWFHNEKLKITQICYEEEEGLAVLPESIEVRIQLPRKLDAILEPGEITAPLPYEPGLKLDDVICQHWDMICEAMDDYFGMELEGWDAELYEEWKAEVDFESEQVYFRNWDPYSVENEALDRMMKEEGTGNRYDSIVVIGRMSLGGSEPELALDKTECYEEGVHLIRRAKRELERKRAEETLSPDENAEKTI